MIKFITVAMLLKVIEIQGVPPDESNMFARKRSGKGQRGLRRGGGGLR